jgi:hypothetical protein
MLPFYYSVEAIRKALNGYLSKMVPHLAVVMAYAVVIYIFAVIAFQRKMSGDKVYITYRRLNIYQLMQFSRANPVIANCLATKLYSVWHCRQLI